MALKPIKKIKGVKQSGVSNEDLLRRPKESQNFKEPAQESYGFRNRQLYYAGKDVGQMIADAAKTNPILLSKIASELEKFKKDSLKKRKKKFLFFKRGEHPGYSEAEIGQIFALCDSYILRISELIRKRYESTQDGLAVEFEEGGQLVLNGINVDELVDQCRNNPNPKSVLFLKGVRMRLERLLDSKIGSRNYERIETVTRRLLGEIEVIWDEFGHLGDD